MIHRLSPRQETGSKWLTVTLIGIYIIVVLLLAIQRTDADTRTNTSAKNAYKQQTVYKLPPGMHLQASYRQ